MWAVIVCEVTPSSPSSCGHPWRWQAPTSSCSVSSASGGSSVLLFLLAEPDGSFPTEPADILVPRLHAPRHPSIQVRASTQSRPKCRVVPAGPAGRRSLSRCLWTCAGGAAAPRFMPGPKLPRSPVSPVWTLRESKRNRTCVTLWLARARCLLVANVDTHASHRYRRTGCS